MKKKQTFTEMLNGLIENGLTITRYQSPNNFDFAREGQKRILMYISMKANFIIQNFT